VSWACPRRVLGCVLAPAYTVSCVSCQPSARGSEIVTSDLTLSTDVGRRVPTDMITWKPPGPVRSWNPDVSGVWPSQRELAILRKFGVQRVQDLTNIYRLERDVKRPKQEITVFSSPIKVT
jgi:hypothetical protein